MTSVSIPCEEKQIQKLGMQNFVPVMAMSRARHTEIFCIEGSERWKQHSKFVPGRGRMKWRGGRASRMHLPENQVPPKEDEQIILLCFTEND